MIFTPDQITGIIGLIATILVIVSVIAGGWVFVVRTNAEIARQNNIAEAEIKRLKTISDAEIKRLEAVTAALNAQTEADLKQKAAATEFTETQTRAKILEIQAERERLAQEMAANLARSVSGQLDSLNTQIISANEKLDKAESRNNELEAKIEKLAAEAEDNVAKLKDSNAKLDTANETLKILTEKLDEALQSLAERKEEIGVGVGALDNAINRIGDLRTVLQNFIDHDGGLEKLQDGLLRDNEAAKADEAKASGTLPAETVAVETPIDKPQGETTS